MQKEDLLLYHEYQLFAVSVVGAGGLPVVEQFVLVVGEGVGAAVEGLLVEQLRLQEVAHGRRSCAVEVAVEA